MTDMCMLPINVSYLMKNNYYHLKTKTADGQPITFLEFVPVFRNQEANLLES